jgi:squalene synthase HpnC
VNAVARVAEPRIALPSAAAIDGRAGGENFAVASRLLPRAQREHLRALYGFARLADELGDEIEGDRLAALDWLERELDLAYAGAATHPLLRRLEPTLVVCRLPRDPFQRLIEANRQDQHVRRYQSWESLRAYCHLSADPVGELVLYVFGVATPERVERSNAICTALQLIEHCQDVAEDLERDRVYMPLEDLARFELRVDELATSVRSQAVRQLIELEVDRARGLLRDGAPLIAALRGRARLAVAGFVGCGHAALDAIVANGYDVMDGAPRASKRARLAATVRALAEGRR